MEGYLHILQIENTFFIMLHSCQTYFNTRVNSRGLLHCRVAAYKCWCCVDIARQTKDVAKFFLLPVNPARLQSVPKRHYLVVSLYHWFFIMNIMSLQIEVAWIPWLMSWSVYYFWGIAPPLLRFHFELMEHFLSQAVNFYVLGVVLQVKYATWYGKNIFIFISICMIPSYLWIDKISP